MRYLLAIILALPFYSNSQNLGDSKITVNLTDTIDLYKRVKIALIDFNFIVKDNYNYDTLTTYAKEFSNINGQCRVTAIIKDNTVTLSGIYGLKKIDDWGYTQSPKDFQNIIYFKGSKSWTLLKAIAERLGDKFVYSK